jgi:hypothetical protein
MGWALTADNITDIGAIPVAHLKCEGFQTSLTQIYNLNNLSLYISKTNTIRV